MLVATPESRAFGQASACREVVATVPGRDAEVAGVRAYDFGIVRDGGTPSVAPEVTDVEGR